MAEDKGSTAKKGFSLDWLIGGVLSKLGDTFDRITGRNWNPSSNLATSKLEEKLKLLLDAEVREEPGGGRFVPHVFKLKIQWNKFSTDSDSDLKKLEHELHAAAIDHINDRLYHTHAPIEVSVEKDYFVEGVQFIAGFGKFGESEDDEVAVNVTLKNIPVGEIPPAEEPHLEDRDAQEEAPGPEICFDLVVQGKPVRRCVAFGDAKRFSVGRSGTNDIVIDDPSVSKVHASVALSSSGGIVIADTGSTNGTFIGGSRMPYGKAAPLSDGMKVRFGDIEALVSISSVLQNSVNADPAPSGDETPVPVTEAFDVPEPAPTMASNEIEGLSDDTPKTREDWEV
ncbi:MAG: FHA domain-containing protein [Acidobacteriota bacterium]|nr:MAG: FHA domain-containing protein [Acidobacteriota bacterium]